MRYLETDVPSYEDGKKYLYHVSKIEEKVGADIFYHLHSQGYPFPACSQRFFSHFTKRKEDLLTFLLKTRDNIRNQPTKVF